MQRCERCEEQDRLVAVKRAAANALLFLTCPTCGDWSDRPAGYRCDACRFDVLMVSVRGLVLGCVLCLIVALCGVAWIGTTP